LEKSFTSSNGVKNDNETLTSSITQSTQAKGGKGRTTKGEDPSQSLKSKTQNGSQRSKGTNYFPPWGSGK
jgi:hypothetical protein